MKKFKMLCATLLLTFSMSGFSAVRYISDDVVIYLHSGPGLSYRIIGTLQVGSEVNTLKYDEESKFMQVKSKAGRVGWMKLSELQETLPAKNLLPIVQEKLKVAEEKLANIAAENAAALADKEQRFEEQNTLVANMKEEKASLQQQILDLKARNLELDLLQETKESRIQMEWLINGGGVLFFGLVIGLLIPFLPRRKKRSKDW